MSNRIIVVGVDGSETAEQASRRAAEIAAISSAELHVLASYSRFEVDAIEPGVPLSSVDDVQLVAEQTVTALRGAHPDVEIVAAPAEGKPADALVRHAERVGADLIVVGNKRAQGLARVLGSVARDVTAHAPCDVYVVHTHAAH
ncbi:universal stress protein [Nocardioides sp. zg-536]|uniref:Universal stress protein n=1 Tax=Nocardioides faecalis TaxID=2803858 RepID=A0A938Y3J6_9ACTN|nr:universal stress protein [Nocardioides faecalis]MBM9461221.1 universal stress protein [Nocardioides faecalis]MBS4752126.1 universal stress protein [Nocardioides faecalis]QVI59066.1 universal stress protein [Nocardioides faecalis]